MAAEGHRLQDLVRGKRVLCLATKNLDYIRIQQEIHLIREYGGKLTILGKPFCPACSV